MAVTRHSIDPDVAGFCAPVSSDGAPVAGGSTTDELKYVTVVRSDLVASTDMVAELDPEAAIRRLEPALAAMRAAVRRFGGIVGRELGDGVLAVFGAPIAQDNHATSGVYAALDLVERVAALGPDTGFRVRVGVHTGWVVAHTVKTEFSSAYDMGGPALHLVERLQSVALPGHVYVSEPCRKLSEGHVAYTSLPPQRLKGFPHPVPLYRADRIAEVSNWRVRAVRGTSPFVGRDDELRQLERCAADTTRGFVRTVSLVGEPGIGKSRLAHEFAAALTRDGWRVIEAECSALSQSLPYALLKNLLLSVFAQETALDPRTQAAENAACAMPASWAPALAAVLDLPVQDRAWTELQPGARRTAIAAACRAVFERATASVRTAVLIEDVHWMDGASGEILQDLSAHRFAHPFMLLFTARPAGAPAWLGSFATSQIALRPLDGSSGETLLDALLGSTRAAPALKARILRHTGRVPLFIEEVCRQLTETGPAKGDRAAAANALEDLGVPPTVQGVIAARIDRLDASARTVIQLASAIGASGAVAVLSKLAGGDNEAFLQRIEALDATGLLRQVNSWAEQTFEFPHELVRQVAYESMLESTRIQIHRRILAVLEAETREHAEDRSAVLCHHASHARDWERTIDYARKVARTCIARSALADASEKFGLAIAAADQLAPSIEREQAAIDLRIESRMAFSAFGRVDRWLQLAREAEARAEAIGDTPRKVAAMAVRSAALNFHGAAHEAVRAGELSLRQAQALGHAGWINYTRYGLAQACFIAGRYRDAERLLALTHARLTSADAMAIPGTTVPDMLVLCCMMKAVVHVQTGNLQLADACQREAQLLASRSNRPYDLVAAGYATGVYLLAIGNARAAQTCLRRALTLAREHHVKLFVPVIGCQLGIACFERGENVTARRVLMQARDQAKAVGHVSAMLRACAYLALVFATAGKTRMGLRLARQSGRAARAMSFAGIQSQILAFETQIRGPAAAGENARDLRRSLVIARRSGARPLAVQARRLLAQALRRVAHAQRTSQEGDPPWPR